MSFMALFAEKVILELKCTKSLPLELIRNDNSVFYVLPKQLWMNVEGHSYAQNFFLSEKKRAKCNFNEQAQVHEKCFF